MYAALALHWMEKVHVIKNHIFPPQDVSNCGTRCDEVDHTTNPLAQDSQTRLST